MMTKYSVAAQSAGSVEYADCIFAEGFETPHDESFVYDIKQSEGETPVMMELWPMWSYLFIAIAPRFTLAQSGST